MDMLDDIKSFFHIGNKEEIAENKRKRDERRKQIAQEQENRKNDRASRKEQEKLDAAQREAERNDRKDQDDKDRKAAEAAKLSKAAGAKSSGLGLGIMEGEAGGGTAPAAGAGAAADAKATSGNDLKKMGLKIKEGDVQAAEGSLSPRLVELAKKVQNGIPGFSRITGLNDRWHNENSPASKHTKGIAMDFVLDHQPSEEEGQKIISMLKGMGANFVIDEYNHPSAKATAGHIHTEVPLQAQKGGIFDGPNTGYPVMLHGKEMITPLNPANLTAGTAQAAQSQIAKATGEGDSNQDTVTALQRLIDIQERSLRTLKTIAENV